MPGDATCHDSEDRIQNCGCKKPDICYMTWSIETKIVGVRSLFRFRNGQNSVVQYLLEESVVHHV